MVLSMSEAVVVALVGGLVLLLLKYPNRAIGTSKSDLPKPPIPTFPLLGNLPHLLATRNRMYEHQVMGQELSKDVSFSFTMPGLRVIVLRTPEQIEWVQKTNFANYVKGDLQAPILRDVLGTGIFASDGHIWTAARKTTSYIFSANSFRTVISRAIDSHISTLVKVLGKSADSGREVALNEVFFRLTLDAFVSMSFGQELGSLEADKPVPFAIAFDHAQTQLDRRFASPGWRITERFSAEGRRMREAIKIIDDFSYSIIDARDRQAADEKDSPAVDLLALYRGIKDEKGQKMTRKELRDSVLNLIIAGRDTTAQALSWLYFYIASDPSLLDPIRKEIKELLSDGRVTYDNYQSLVQTKALFYEAVRLHPSVPKNGKLALADDQIPNGPFVRKGDAVSWSDWALARNTNIWGADAKQFKPSRWVAEDGSFKRVSSWVFHSFNAGPRLCLGQNLATFEAICVIVALTRHFDITFAPGYLETVELADGELGDIKIDAGKPTPLYAMSLTLPMAQPMRVHLARRSQDA